MNARSLVLCLLTRPGAATGLILLLLQVVAILFASHIARFSPVDADPLSATLPPGGVHWFGTDELGMDVFSRVVFATRINLLISFAAVGASLAIGVPAGLLIGYYKGFLSTAVLRVFDFLQSFPIFVLGMALVAVLGQEIWSVVIALSLLFVPMFGRLVRAEVLSLRERPFVAAARCAGANDLEIMVAHILPNAITPVIVQVSVAIGMAILLTAGLSFIGAGVRMPSPEWGLMVSNGAQQMILGVWWISLFPGLAIVVSVLSFALLADAVRDLTDPRAQGGRRAGGP
jgi:peptide/nickel transport system permease protein